MSTTPTRPGGDSPGTPGPTTPATPAAPGRPGRPGRPTGPVVTPLDNSGAIFAPVVPDFSGYVTQQLGTAGSGRDGFDALFSIPAGAIDNDTAGLSVFDDLLSAAAFTPGDFARTTFAPIDTSLAALIADGDQLNSAVQNPGPITVAPVITPPPNPPGGTVSGGGGGGGGGSFGGSGGGTPPDSGPSDLPGWDIPDPATGTIPGSDPGIGGDPTGPPIIVIPPHPVIL